MENDIGTQTSYISNIWLQSFVHCCESGLRIQYSFTIFVVKNARPYITLHAWFVKINLFVIKEFRYTSVVFRIIYKIKYIPTEAAY